MNWDQIQVNWMHFKDKVRNNWAKLTDEDVTRIGGRRERADRARCRRATALPKPKPSAKSKPGSRRSAMRRWSTLELESSREGD